MNPANFESPESEPTPPPAESRQKFKGLLLLVVLLAPAVVTSFLALFNIASLISGWVLTSSPVAGIMSGIMLSRTSEGSLTVKFLIALILVPVLTAVCLVTCFMGCGWAGGGGI